MRAHQKLSRHVGDGARALGRIGAGRADPALQQPIAHRVGQRHVVIVSGRQRGEFSLDIEEVVHKRVLERVFRHRRPIIFGRRHDRHCCVHLIIPSPIRFASLRAVALQDSCRAKGLWRPDPCSKTALLAYGSAWRCTRHGHLRPGRSGTMQNATAAAANSRTAYGLM